MIEIKDLQFSYKKSFPIFHNVSLRMQSGVYGLLGENGVGKSTLLRLIAGLRFPTAGSCQIDGVDTHLREPETLEKVFFLPEVMELPSVTVEQFVGRHAPFYSNFNRAEFEQYLQEFNIVTDRKLNEMSYGQRKKVMIAYGLALNTPYVLMDEPTNGLDIPSKSQFRKVISSASHQDRCIVISTHQVRDLETLIDPIIILNSREVLLNHSVREITEKLVFDMGETAPQNALYAESVPAGWAYVAPNTTGEVTHLNLELLFNAATSSRKEFKTIFDSTTQP